MTEADWLACANAKRLLNHIPYHVSKRKWRLLAAAFCRRIWPLLTDERSKRAVEAAEKWADGLIQLKELKLAQTAAQPYQLGLAHVMLQEAPGAAYGSAIPSKHSTVSTAFYAREAVEVAGGSGLEEERNQCDLIRDILGYPYRSVTIMQTIRVWNEGTVVKLAQSIYDERAFDRLPILADALEDAGCTNADILNHCRQPGEHVRGCWVIDLLLGKT
jgi:hypothetical protein